MYIPIFMYHEIIIKPFKLLTVIIFYVNYNTWLRYFYIDKSIQLTMVSLILIVNIVII